MRTTIPDNVIEGSLTVLGMAEAVHLGALFLGLPFHVCAAILAVLLFCGILAGAGLRVWKTKKQGHTLQVEKHAAQGAAARHSCIFLLAGLLVILQMVWYYWAHVPYIQNDITGETVQTILASDRLYALNPLTGRDFSAGMPMRLKILVLPTFYAFVCRLTGWSAMTVCYSLMPCVVLLLSYTVYLGWAEYLFSSDEKKRLLFLGFVMMIYQFGAYALPMDGYTLLFGGYQGEAVRTGVLLPYALLCCLRGRWRGLLLCLLAEVCVVWTFYGLGYVAVTALLYGVVRLLLRRQNRRETK